MKPEIISRALYIGITLHSFQCARTATRITVPVDTSRFYERAKHLHRCSLCPNAPLPRAVLLSELIRGAE